MPQETPEGIQLLGGRLCLDFANTVDWTAGREPVGPELDALHRPDCLARWGRRLGLASAGRPGTGELHAARELRAAVYAAFAAIGEGERPAPGSLATIARHHGEAAEAARLQWEAGAGRLAWDPREPRLVRFAVAVDAVGLLADPELVARVRRCPGRDCGWLFLDASGRRRWCTMRTCGSREKMRRLRAR